MEWACTLITLSIFILIGNTVEARPNPRTMGRDVLENMPIEGIFRKGTSMLHIPTTKTNANCRDAATTNHMPNVKDDFEKKRGNFASVEEKATDHVNDFEPRPNISAYDNKASAEEKVDEFEPRPNISVYDNGVVRLHNDNGKNDDFEPRPNISIYDNGFGLNSKKTENDEFEPRPNLSVYDNDIIGSKNGNIKDDDFEPRPNISIYDNGFDLKNVKAENDEFEPRPNISVYDNAINVVKSEI